MNDYKENQSKQALSTAPKITKKGFSFKRKTKPAEHNRETAQGTLDTFDFDEVEKLIAPANATKRKRFVVEQSSVFPLLPLDDTATSVERVLAMHRKAAIETFTGSEQYLADAVARTCESVLDSIKGKEGSETTGTEKNAQLMKQKQQLLDTIERMQAELDSWEKVESASNLTNNPILQTITTTEDPKSAVATPSKETMRRSIELASEINEGLSKIERNVTFQSQCIENKLLSVQHVMDKAQQSKARLVSSISEKAFKGYERKGDTRSLIKKFLSAATSASTVENEQTSIDKTPIAENKP